MRSLDEILEGANAAGLLIRLEDGKVRARYFGPSGDAVAERLLRELYPYQHELATRLSERPVAPPPITVKDRRDVSEASRLRRFDHNGEEIDELGMRVIPPAKRYAPSDADLAASHDAITNAAARTGHVWAGGQLFPIFQTWHRR